MIYIVSLLGTISSDKLVENTKHIFPAATPKQISETYQHFVAILKI